MALQKQYDPSYLKSVLGADDVERYAPGGQLPTDNVDELRSMFGASDIDALLGGESKPAESPAAPATTMAQSGPMAGLQTAMGGGGAMRGPEPGWQDNPMAQQNAEALGDRTPPAAVTTLSEIMRRFGRAY